MGGDGSSSRRRAAGTLGLETALDEGVGGMWLLEKMKVFNKDSGWES